MNQNTEKLIESIQNIIDCYSDVPEESKSEVMTTVFLILPQIKAANKILKNKEIDTLITKLDLIAS